MQHKHELMLRQRMGAYYPKAQFCSSVAPAPSASGHQRQQAPRSRPKAWKWWAKPAQPQAQASKPQTAHTHPEETASNSPTLPRPAPPRHADLSNVLQHRALEDAALAEPLQALHHGPVQRPAC